ncbi:MAG: copper resistance protein CopC [Nitrospirae bacterium]|nr:copper resistance protein CopC [Nitrospirota bacterium]
MSKHSPALMVLVFLFLLALRGVSEGHAFPDHSDPRVGSTITASPAKVRIWFDGELEPVFCIISVKDMSGKKVDKGDGHVNASDPTLLEASLQPLSPGNYQVAWSVVARDGHRTEGNYLFTVK